MHPHYINDDDLHIEDEVPVIQDNDFIDRSNISGTLYRIKVDANNETYFIATQEQLASGSFVIAQTKYGKDICKVLGAVQNLSKVLRTELMTFERKATDADLEKRKHDIEKEKQAFEICKQKIQIHGLAMDLIGAHYLFDEPKIIFFFSAETRIDFRELVKDLVAILKVRIELRQIGVRDKARMIGGCGICGRILCCHAITDKLMPVSIKMAKDQNLSLNSLKISGPCGCLLCCLSYEFDYYSEVRKSLPQEGTRVNFENQVFKVVEINIPALKIHLSGEEGQHMWIDANALYENENGWNVRTESIKT